MSTDYEPTKEAVEALAKELCSAYVEKHPAAQDWSFIPEQNRRGYLAEARFVLRRQHERERGLLRFLSELSSIHQCAECGHEARRVLAAHAKLDAPKVPTLLAAAKAAVWPADMGDTTQWIAVRASDWNALKAAVEREERGA